MTSKAKSLPTKDFKLHFFSEQDSDEELRTTFRKKWEWVVWSPKPNAFWYSVLLSNLHQRNQLPEVATMDSVRQEITKGMKRSAFNRLKEITQISREDLGAVVRIPARTLSRREVFHPDESERILRVAAAFQRTIEVFEDLPKARHWFSTPKRALGGQSPLQFCDTEVGADEVVNLLGRIEQGVFS